MSVAETIREQATALIEARRRVEKHVESVIFNQHYDKLLTEDAHLIAQAYLDAQVRLDDAIAVLIDIQWALSDEFENPWSECPECHADKLKRVHKPDCRLAAVLDPTTEAQP